MTERERALRRRLGIADDASKVLVFEQSAHCDWDWTSTFPEYFSNAVGNTILPPALSDVATSGYTYVFCEVAYLKRFWKTLTSTQQKAWVTAVANGAFLFSSGGLTSAENLTLHTEAFIRNYLLGRQWVATTFGTQPSLQMWIPDDFGHDAQLPALLRAMGYTGAGFWRVPAQWGGPSGPGGDAVIGGKVYDVSASAEAPSTFLVNGTKNVDFIWKARDGSTVQAHWLMGSYGQGNWGTNHGPSFGSGTIISESAVEPAITSFIDYFANVTPGSHIFVPCAADFCAPYSNFPAVIRQWNDNYASQYGVTVKLASFDHFMGLVGAPGDLPVLESNPTDGSNAYLPHPYWSGCYATHPALKLGHFQAARTLLLAEAMELIVEYLVTLDSGAVAAAAQARATLVDGWTTLAPSTHHDYITGTAPNGIEGSEDVYGTEQVPVLTAALTQAIAARTSIFAAIAGAIDAGDAAQGTPVALFNPIALARGSGLVELAIANPSGYSSCTTDGGVFNPVQTSASGTLVTLATLPALGYATAWLTAESPTKMPTLTIEESDNVFTLTNDFVKATIGTGGITGWFDLSASDPTRNLLTADGNALFYYQDTGGLYRFGNEVVADNMVFQQVASPCSATITATEQGPVRVSVVVSGTATVDGQSIPFTITYSLVALEQMLRIATESAAPASTDNNVTGYSVMVGMPFATVSGPVAELAYGTTAHWDRRAPRGNFLTWTLDGAPAYPPELDDMTFEPTHEFVVPYDKGGNLLGAIYHYSVPAWAIASDGSGVFGCILRNTPNKVNGAQGTDTASHTLTYALRVPSGLADPSTGCGVGTPLGEALLFNNPVSGVPIPQSSTGTLPSSMLIASTANPTALVTVAKAGTVHPAQMIVRVYQPTDGTLDGVEVAIDPRIASMFQSNGVLNASAVTALEVPSSDIPSLTSDATSFTLTMPYARATVALSRDQAKV